MTYSDKPCIVIAEAGVNHNGSIDLAKDLVLEARDCGADYIKFQTFVPSLVASSDAPTAGYQSSAGFLDQQSMLEGLMLNDEEHSSLRSYCEQAGIGFSSTGHDIDSAEYLQKLGQDFVKIGSGDLTNWQLLEKVSRFGKPIFLSTGASTLEEVADTLLFLESCGVSPATDVTLMQCTSAYPAPEREANIRVLTTYVDRFGCKVGYSDHTQTFESALAAITLGASVIEKHLTLDRSMTGPDHKASLEPSGFADYVSAIRRTEEILGSNRKLVTRSEKENQSVIRKSLYARTEIKAGDKFSEKNIVAKRPSGRIPASAWSYVRGQRAQRTYLTDEPIDVSSPEE